MSMRVQADLTKLLKQVWVNGYVTAKIEHHPPNYQDPVLSQKEVIVRWYREIKKEAIEEFDLNSAIYDFKFEVTSNAQ